MSSLAATLPYLALSILVVTLIALAWRDPASSHKLRETFFRNANSLHRNRISLLLGALASFVALTSGIWTISTVTWIFNITLAFTILLLVAVRPRVERQLDEFAWGLPIIIILGFASGALIYQSRSWWVWCWRQLLRLDQPHEWALSALFLIGAMLGAFVVRNWAKEQAAFIESLSGVLGGTFVAVVFVKMFESVPDMSQRAFSVYALGFTISGTINLILAARWTAIYTNTRSIRSRAMLDFLYGSERTKLIDGYFLQNFKDDPDYARARLTDALIEYRKLIAREFAERLQKKVIGPEQLSSPPRGPQHYYQMIAIESEVQQSPPIDPTIPEKDRLHKVVVKRLRSDPVANSEESSNGIREEMFRVGVAAHVENKLEYISAPGEYKVAFPFLQSVSGLALLARQTIVMDRDKYKRFRDKDNSDGISPSDKEQLRGLDEIDFLSYIAVPILGHFNGSSENQLGVVTIDSKLFIARDLVGEVINESLGVLRVQVKPSDLTEYASRMYDPEDADVKYIEQVTKIIVPVMELYAKCRVGTT